MACTEVASVMYGDRDRLLALRAKLLVGQPSKTLDLEIHQLLGDCGHVELVLETIIYQADGKEDYRRDGHRWLSSTNESIGVLNDDGSTTYWSGAPPKFWDDLSCIPQYTARVDAAFTLRTDRESRFILEEKIVRSVDEDGEIFSRAFQVTIQSARVTHVSDLGLRSPVMATLVAIIDYNELLRDAFILNEASSR